MGRSPSFWMWRPKSRERRSCAAVWSRRLRLAPKGEGSALLEEARSLRLDWRPSCRSRGSVVAVAGGPDTRGCCRARRQRPQTLPARAKPPSQQRQAGAPRSAASSPFPILLLPPVRIPVRPPTLEANGRVIFARVHPSCKSASSRRAAAHTAHTRSGNSANRERLHAELRLRPFGP